MSGQGPTTSSALWHGFADMGAVQRDGAFVFARGEGAYVFDTEGNRYLDATAGLWFANVGHGRAEVADAVRDQLLKVAHVTGFGDAATDTTVALAERLQGIAPVPDSKIFFTSGGSDSVDSAIKLARRYWQEKGRPEKKLIVGRSNAYHGMHVGGTSLGGIPVNAEGYGGVLFDDTATVAWDDAKELLGLIERVGAEAIAAFVAEPVIGAGGLLPPPEGYLREVRDICREHDVLFIADEVITGFGRIGGAWFASSRFDLEPDLMTTAKGLTSGYVPMGRCSWRRTSPSPSSRAACGGGTATPTAGTRRRPRHRWPCSTSWSARTSSRRRCGCRTPCCASCPRSPITRRSRTCGAASARSRACSCTSRRRRWRW